MPRKVGFLCTSIKAPTYGAHLSPVCHERATQLFRRAPHPLYSAAFELQSFECQSCGREIHRSADRVGFHFLVMPNQESLLRRWSKSVHASLFIHDHPGGQPQPSNTFDCKDDGAAKKEASGTFADMSRDISKRLQLNDSDWQIEVADEAGKSIFKIKVATESR